ncbi:MAG: hypothetical protein JWO71_3449 [Candidatus Acidoferrum typicum]|nr:hypothetical protein [Candidatus Acidoferrum typicum]
MAFQDTGCNPHSACQHAHEPSDVTGAIDKNSSGTLSAGSAITSTYSIDSTGLGLLPAGCSIAGGTCQDVFFIVWPSKAVLLETASGKKNPNLQVSDK